ncbi:MAG: hypothetical protein KL787_10835 [Taibaiella sp.]|nr:hypothetical protein [Taibaiella sp.]
MMPNPHISWLIFLTGKECLSQSDEMFEKAIELGDVSVVGCWVQSMYRAKRMEKKTFSKDLLEKVQTEQYR